MPSEKKRKILVVELWGLGDLTFATPLIAAALEKDEVHLLAKEHAQTLLAPSFPNLKFITYDAPWTVYRGKYRFWEWNWMKLIKLVLHLRKEKYDIAVSVRNDPRNHFFMWLIGAVERISFLLEGARRFLDTDRIFLTTCLERLDFKQHKVRDWHQIGRQIGLGKTADMAPTLRHSRYRSEKIRRIFANIDKPVICIHAGARIAVRRWPEHYFARIIKLLRRNFDFHLIVVPEPGTTPSVLASHADTWLPDLTIRELIDLLGRSDLLICNDSGPAHIASCCGRPSIPIFGPSDPEWFRPWGEEHKVIIRDICPWRPCFDYCRFSEAHCMTKLLPADVWPEIEQHILSLIAIGKLPEALSRPEESPEVPMPRHARFERLAG